VPKKKKAPLDPKVAQTQASRRIQSEHIYVAGDLDQAFGLAMTF